MSSVGTFEPFGRNQFSAMLKLSVQQCSLSVEQNSALSPSPISSAVIMVLLISWLEPCSSVTPK